MSLSVLNQQRKWLYVQELSYPVVYLVAQSRGRAVARRGMVRSNHPKERGKAFRSA
jgi:hypothetical protein